jgi:hypothetical protein
MDVIKNPYVYEPFEDKLTARPIRLLRLLPVTSFIEDIRCELFNTTLDAKEDFEALSYTWGNPSETSPVVLHGQRHDVTKNLASALRHLRYHDRQRILWVDALCIDQDNIEERNQQVTQMRDIYREGGAKRVVVWLGEVPNARIGACLGAVPSGEGKRTARNLSKRGAALYVVYSIVIYIYKKLFRL